MAGGNGGEFRYRRDVGRLVGFCGAGAALQTHLAAICKYGIADARAAGRRIRSEEHTSELQSLMRISYAVFCLKKKNQQLTKQQPSQIITIIIQQHQHTYSIL